MLKGGISTHINTRHQAITCMKEYEGKSFEVSIHDMIVQFYTATVGLLMLYVLIHSSANGRFGLRPIFDFF